MDNQMQKLREQGRNLSNSSDILYNQKGTIRKDCLFSVFSVCFWYESEGDFVRSPAKFKVEVSMSNRKCIWNSEEKFKKKIGKIHTQMKRKTWKISGKVNQALTRSSVTNVLGRIGVGKKGQDEQHPLKKQCKHRRTWREFLRLRR